MILILFLICISSQAMELTKFPSAQCPTDNGAFGQISHDNLSLILSFVYAEKIEGFILRSINDTIKKYTDKEITKNFLTMPIYYLVNKLFFKMHSQLIDKTYRDNHFSYQGYFRASSEEKKIINKQYDEFHLNAILRFIDSTVDLAKNPFSNFNPLYRVSSQDLYQFVEVSSAGGNSICWICDYLSTYDTKFGKQESYNLFTFFALALVSLGHNQNKETSLVNAYKLIKSKDLLMIFYQMFFNGPFCSQAKNLFLQYFIASPPDEITDCFCYGTSMRLSVEERIKNLTKFLYENNSLLQKTALAHLKKHLVPSKYRKSCVSFFNPETKESSSVFKSNKTDLNFILSMYLSIFNINNNLVLQESLKDDFEQFFLDNNYNDYLKIINTVREEKFDFWTVFEKLDSVVESETLKNFLKKYNSPQIVNEQLNSREFCLNNPEYFFKLSCMMIVLGLIVDSINQDLKLPKLDSFFVHIINSYDRKIDDLETINLERNKSGEKFLVVIDKIVSFLAQKTGHKHEVIAQNIGFKNYTNTYCEVQNYCRQLSKLSKNKTDFEIRMRIEKQLWLFFLRNSSMIHSFNPLFCFSDGLFLFETVFALDYSHNDMKERMVEAILAINEYCYSLNEPSKMVEIIKKTVKSDSDLHDNMPRDPACDCWSPISICLPHIIKVTNELKELVARDNDLMDHIVRMHNAFKIWNSTIKEKRNIINTQALEFLEGFLKESMVVANIEYNDLSRTLSDEKNLSDAAKSDAAKSELKKSEKLNLSFLQRVKESIGASFFFKALVGSVGAIGLFVGILYSAKIAHKKFYPIFQSM